MRNRHDRLTKCGIVALAGIAVLGWVREPEKHHFSESTIDATAAVGYSQSRATFVRPSAVTSVMGMAQPLADTHANGRTHDASSPVATPPMVIGRIPQRGAEAPVVISKKETPQALGDEVVNRSRKPREERWEDRRASTQPVPPPEEPEVAPKSTPVPRAERRDDTDAQTRPVVDKKNRSTARSAAIIIGTTVAGAAIGAAAGGGKGAAIGAITGSAGGYVYDRMTRRNGTASSSGVLSDIDQQGQDHEPSLARRFGTPGFSGR